MAYTQQPIELSDKEFRYVEQLSGILTDCSIGQYVIVAAKSRLPFNGANYDSTTDLARLEIVRVTGVKIHPRNIKLGDRIGYYPFDWYTFIVNSIEFNPDDNDIPDYHRSGCYSFNSTSNTFVNGRCSSQIMYKFTDKS